MKIVIVGCGKVGRNVAEELVKENHSIVLVDSNGSLVEQISNSIDVLGVVGNGTSVSTLKDAGIEDADLLLAVTNSDEVNILCCLFAKKVNKDCKTIARVRDPMYNEEIGYLRDELGLTMTINPEMITAREISRLIRWPSALKVDSFARGRIELISFLVNEDTLIVNKKIKDIMSTYRDPILFVGIERKDEAIIPNGDTVILKDDKVSVLATPLITSSFLNKIGIYSMPIKNCMLVGGSSIAYYLAKILDRHKVNVCIIDKDSKKCNKLSEELPNASIINAYASDDNVLIEEGLPDADCFCSLTGNDEENVLLSLFAKTISKAKVITKVNHISYEGVLRNLDVGALVSPKQITATNIVSYVRAMSNAGDNEIEVLHRIMNGKAEAMSFVISKKSDVIGIPFEKLHIKNNLLVGSIVRGNEIIVPTGKTTMEIGDTVLVVTTNTGLTKIEDIVK